jgi:hypothetical protein
LKPTILAWTAGWPEQIGGQSLDVMQQDRGLLVHIGVNLDSALLPEHTSKVLQGMESVPC